MSHTQNDKFKSENGQELKVMGSTRIKLAESEEDFDEFNESVPLTNGNNDAIVPYGPRISEFDDEVDGVYENGNGFQLKPPKNIPSGYFPQWPTSYPVDAIDNVPSLNLYQQKKSMAQGMLDLALLSANANQLRYVLDSKDHTSYFYISISLIAISLVFQVLVAFALVFKARYNVEKDVDYQIANRINNFILVGILVITIANVLSSAFAPSTAT